MLAHPESVCLGHELRLPCRFLVDDTKKAKVTALHPNSGKSIACLLS